MDQKIFVETIKEFKKIEDSRNQLWERAKKLIAADFEIEAYILILSTWNFASFRYEMKTFNLLEFQKVIANINPIFKKLENQVFMEIDFNNGQLLNEIKHIFKKLKSIAKQTGATKIMALKNPSLFIMWDTKIRKMYNVRNSCTPDEYIDFLKAMKNTFSHIKWSEQKGPFAKAIDEYNYVTTNKPDPN